jgi:hypothetical protein
MLRSIDRFVDLAGLWALCSILQLDESAVGRSR